MNTLATAQASVTLEDKPKVILNPIADRVIIIQDKPNEASKGGIILPTQAQEGKPRGKVVAIGPKVRDVQVGDYVLFNINWKQEFKDEGVEYIIINEPDVLAILSADAEAEMKTVN